MEELSTLENHPVLLPVLGGFMTLALGCFVVDLGFLQRRWRQPSGLSAPEGSWVGYLMLAWIGLTSGWIISLAFMEVLALLKWTEGLGPIALSGAAMQLTLLAFCYLIAARHPIGKAFRERPPSARVPPLLAGLFCYLAAVPLVGLVAFLWAAMLQEASKLWGWGAPSPQALVELLLANPGLSPGKLALVFVAVILAPIAEEAFFRGLVYRAGKALMPPPLALMISALLFALVHFSTYAFAPLFVFGLLLARAYERTGDLRVPMVMHACFNLASLLMIHFFSGV